MINIIFGSDETASRNHLSSLLTKNVIRYSPDTIDFEEIIQLTQGGGLFQEEKTILIENFFSKKNKNIDKLSEYFNLSKNANLILWQDRELTASEIKKLKNVNLQEFKLSKFLFNFLDQIKPENPSNIKNFHEALKTTEVELLFFMLIKQFRMLLSLKSYTANQIDETKRLADWQKSKLLKQASFFPDNLLRTSFIKLAAIDKQTKTGEGSFSLSQSIDIWLTNL